MTAEAAVLIRTFGVGKRTCTLTIPKPKQGDAVCMTAEWRPNMPRRLSRREWREYRAGRDAALAELAAVLGVTAAVVDL